MATGGDPVAKLQEVTSPGNLGRTAAFIAAYAAAHVSPLAPGLAVLDAYFIGSSAGELGLALYQLYLDLESATTEGELTSASDSLSSMLSGPIADSLLKLLTLGAAKGAAVFRKNFDLKISIDPNKLGSNLGNVEIKITRKGVPDRAQPADGRSLKAKAGDLEEAARKNREYDPKPLAPNKQFQAPEAVVKNQATHDLMVSNQQKALKEAIDQAPAAEKASVAGRVLAQQGGDFQALSHDTLGQISGASVQKNVKIATGVGSEIDDIVSKAGKRAFVESKLTIRELDDRTINQLKNAVNSSNPGDTVILNVARQPTARELGNLQKALGETWFGKIKVVSSQTDLFREMKSALD